MRRKRLAVAALALLAAAVLCLVWALVRFGRHYGADAALSAFMMLFVVAFACAVFLNTPKKTALRIPQFFASAALGIGGMAFFFLNMASEIVPSEWEWPAPVGADAMIVPGDLRAVKLPAKRIQIYDAKGTYKNGWFVDIGYQGEFRLDNAGLGRIVIFSSSLEPSSRDKTSVTLYRKRVFGLDGERISDDIVSRGEYFAPPSGRFIAIHLSTPWHLLPLADRMYATALLALGFLGSGLVEYMGRKMYPHLHPRKAKGKTV